MRQQKNEQQSRFILSVSLLLTKLLEFSKSVKALKNVEEVLTLAKQFEQHVFYQDAMQGILDMEDDIPV